MRFCHRTLGFAALFFDENLLEMKWLQKITVFLFVVYGLRSQLEMKKKKSEELYKSCTRTVLRMGKLANLHDRTFEEGPITSTQLLMAKTQARIPRENVQ